jgi:hypothetical protein
VKGAKHLWVGEPMVHLVLSEIIKLLRQADCRSLLKFKIDLLLEIQPHLKLVK